jgi:homocysteine S-methyltransferase
MDTKSPLDPFFKKQGIVILDGGLATELENRGHNLDHPLWSARLLIKHPDEILAVHRSYLEAGADCIISASYQATLSGLISEGLSEKEAKALIKSTITIACEARDEFFSTGNTEKERIKPIVAASIGPYGAFLANGSEYTGNYDIRSEKLLSFHEPRWELLAQTPADLFACESIPSIYEAEVLRRLLDNTPDIRAWISFTCRDDRHISDGTPIEDCLALFENSTQTIAIGVNCTAPKHILSLVKKITLRLPSKNIVVYPNSGEMYSAKHKTWLGISTPFDFSKEALQWLQAGARLIGGCCRTGPDHVSNLRKILLKNDPIEN